ncbi:MAG: dihydroorotase [Lachnospiraceae bacterium]|nr:dihydroorotase [Lachnospiraceae bacterium]
MSIIIKNGRVIDPASGTDAVKDIFIEGDRIAAMGDLGDRQADRVIDASGLVVMPGLVDLHVHLRDPGFEYKEDVESGCKAAARGGVTSLLAMGNTKPTMDNADRISYVTNKAKALSTIHVYQAGTVTIGLAGEELTDIDAMAAAGVKALSEDGKSVMNAALLEEAMKKCAEHDMLMASHCEDITLVKGGVVNEDAWTEKLGLKGISNAVEDVITARDAILAEHTGCRLHLCHCSTAGCVDIIKGAKKAGVDISAEVCPHHFILTSADIPGNDANYKMNPPLRTQKDVDALIAALADGTISCISTDHAPHGAEEKSRPIEKAPFGIVGIETSAALTYTALVKTGVLSLMQMAEKMSYNPAKVLKIDAGYLAEGGPADLAVFDFDHAYVIDPSEFASKGKNTPFAGREVYGRTRLTVSGGTIVWEELS